MNDLQDYLDRQVLSAYEGRGYYINSNSSVFKDRLANVDVYNNRLEYHKTLLKGKDTTTIQVTRDIQDIKDDILTELNRKYKGIQDIPFLVYDFFYWRIVEIINVNNITTTNKGKLLVNGIRPIKALKSIVKNCINDMIAKATDQMETRRASRYKDVLTYGEAGVFNTDYIFDYTTCQIQSKSWASTKAIKEYNKRGIPKTLEDVGAIKPITKDYVTKEMDKLIDIIANVNLKLTEDIIISAKPSDFILCSENTTGWRSCFAIDGEYHCSTNSFYMVKNFLVAFSLNKDYEKIGRRWVWVDYDGKIVCTGLNYGTFSSQAAKAVRNTIQKEIMLADNKEFIPSDWYVSYDGNNNSDAEAVYKDSEYGVSIHKPTIGDDYKSFSNYFSMYVELPDGLNETDDVNDGYWVDNRHYCDECGDRHYEDDLRYVESADISVCEHCLDNYYTWCDGYGDYYRDVDTNFYYIRDCNYSEDYLENGSHDFIYLDYKGEWYHIDDCIYISDTEEYIYEDDFDSDYYAYDEATGEYYTIEYYEEKYNEK